MIVGTILTNKRAEKGERTTPSQIRARGISCSLLSECLLINYVNFLPGYFLNIRLISRTNNKLE